MLVGEAHPMPMMVVVAVVSCLIYR